MICGSCAASNPLNANYCNACGARLAPRPDFIDGERRHVTALFCDLVGSTEIAARLDAEQWHDIATLYRQVAAGEIAKLGGHVTQYLGDGLVAYFGYPEAREDAPERAVHAGLAIVGGLAALSESQGAALGITLAVRIGLHTGSVVVARGGEAEIGMFGDTPNIAARCQEAAAANTVVMTAAMRDAVGGLFVLEALGARSFKGIDTPVELFRAVAPEVRRRRRYAGGARKRSVFVGRREEMRVLLDRRRRAEDGEGQVVLVTGEPGIGKSRFLEQFLTEIGDSLWLECGGEPLFSNTPFRPVVQILEHALGAERRAGMRARVLLRAVRVAGVDTAEALPLISDLLGLPSPEHSLVALLAPERRRALLLKALCDWIIGAPRHRKTLVLAIEDLHWIDPSTLELIELVAARAASAPLMIVATARPHFRAPWPMRSNHAQIVLGRLDRKHTREMIAGAFGSAAPDAALLDTVADRAEGIPLFAEELARDMIDRAATGEREIPATLRDSLMARLDRMGQAKETAQLAAVLGREFDYGLLRAISAAPEESLRSALATLADADLVYANDNNASYRFKHALVRDAAYEALLKSQRRVLHALVGRTIRNDFEPLAKAHPEILAHHWTEAGDFDQATEAWADAGRGLAARHAYKEAVDAFGRARAALTSLAESAERDQRELELARWWVGAAQIAFGYSAEETRQATHLVRTLAEKSGDSRKQFGHMAGEWMAASSAGDYQYAALLADQLLPLAHANGAPDGLATAYMILTTTRCRTGDLAGAEEAFAAGETLFAGAEYGRRPGAAAQAFGNGAVNAFLLGEIAEAQRRIAPVIQLARTSDNPYERAFSQYMASMVVTLLEDFELARELANKSIEQSTESRFPHFVATSSVVLGRALSALGKAEEGVPLMLEGLRAQEETRARSGLTMYLTWLAASHRANGETDLALATLDRALEINPQEVFYRPETLRLHGDCILQTGDEGRAAANYNAAVELARSIGAGILLARATASLERLQSKRA